MQSKSAFIKVISIIHLAFLSGQVLLLLLLYFVRTTFADQDSIYSGYEKIIAVGCAFLGMIAYSTGNRLFNKKMVEINLGSMPLALKAEHYRGINILRWAMLEGVALLTAVFYYLTGYLPILIVAVVLILLFYTLKPTLSKMASDLNASESEVMDLDRIQRP